MQKKVELVASNNFFWHIREFAAGIQVVGDQKLDWFFLTYAPDF